MTKVFKQIEELLPKMHGWATPQKGCTLAALVFALRPQTVVEIGVWGGRSLVPMALALNEIGAGKAIGIDAWNTQASLDQMADEANRKWWASIDYRQPYDDLLKHIAELKLEHVIKLARSNSDDFEPPERIDILHIDGNHDGDHPLRDAQRYASKVTPGGIVILDDLDWSGGGVQRAALWLQKTGFKELYRLGTGAVYQRIV